MKVKARAVFYCATDDIDDDEKNDGSDVRCAKSIVRDLLRMRASRRALTITNTRPSTIARLQEAGRHTVLEGLFGSAS